MKTALRDPHNKLLLRRLRVGAIAKTKRMAAKMIIFTCSKNKFVKATIDTGRRF
jgi:pyruvate carboxylase